MKRFLLFIPLILFISSCREEIIAPNNPAGNINQPVKEKYQNSYYFVVNAGNITYNIFDYVKFDNSRTQVFISIYDYASGSVEISLLSRSNHLIFSTKLQSGTEGEYNRLNTEIPDAVQLVFKNFTGKFKISLSGY